MNRAILAITAAFLTATAFFNSAAQACISCEHVPVVVRGNLSSPSGSPYYAAKKKKSYAKAKALARAKAKAAAKAKAKAKAKAIAKAKAKAKAKAVAEAKAKAKAKAVAEAKAKAKAEEKAVAKVEIEETTSTAEGSTISGSGDELAEVSTDEPAEPVETAAAPEELGCKKFFPTIEMTLTVPCE